MDKLREHIGTLFNLDKEELAIFFSGFSKTELKKDAIFIEEGKVCDKVGIIEKGLMMCVYNRNGDEIIDEFAFENSFVTNYYSFLTNSPSEKEIRCIEDCTVYIISKPDLERLGKAHPFIERMARITNEKLFLRIHERLKSFLLDTATQRYFKLVSQRKDLIQRIPQYLIASYLNVKPETISRIRKKSSSDLLY